MFSSKANTDKVLAAGCPIIVRMHILSLEYRTPSDGALHILKNDKHYEPHATSLLKYLLDRACFLPLKMQCI